MLAESSHSANKRDGGERDDDDDDKKEKKTWVITVDYSGALYTYLLHIYPEVVQHFVGGTERLVGPILLLRSSHLDQLALGWLLAQSEKVRDGHQTLLCLQDGPHLLGGGRQLHLE